MIKIWRGSLRYVQDGKFGGILDNGFWGTVRNSLLLVETFYFPHLTYFSYIYIFFSFPLRSSWFLLRSCSVTKQSNSWYTIISLKNRRFDGKRATKTTSPGTHREAHFFYRRRSLTCFIKTLTAKTIFGLL